MATRTRKTTAAAKAEVPANLKGTLTEAAKAEQAAAAKAEAEAKAQRAAYDRVSGYVILGTKATVRPADLVRTIHTEAKNVVTISLQAHFLTLQGLSLRDIIRNAKAEQDGWSFGKVQAAAKAGAYMVKVGPSLTLEQARAIVRLNNALKSDEAMGALIGDRTGADLGAYLLQQDAQRRTKAEDRDPEAGTFWTDREQAAKAQRDKTKATKAEQQADAIGTEVSRMSAAERVAWAVRFLSMPSDVTVSKDVLPDLDAVRGLCDILEAKANGATVTKAGTAKAS